MTGELWVGIGTVVTSLAGVLLAFWAQRRRIASDRVEDRDNLLKTVQSAAADMIEELQGEVRRLRKEATEDRVTLAAHDAVAARAIIRAKRDIAFQVERVKKQAALEMATAQAQCNARIDALETMVKSLRSSRPTG